MTSTGQIAKHFRDVYFGGNWTSVNFKDILADVTWQQATTKIHNLNSIATLVFHVNYYIKPISKVFQGEALDANDKFSFDVPSINSAEGWEKLLDRVFAEAEQFAQQIEKLNEEQLFEDFANSNKYGNYYRNLLGIIEHTHYHLGQISLIKKIINEK